jgi:NAD(P)-dependent dehydrogenase (short-subunit alcohol dehydrogenase family)
MSQALTDHLTGSAPARVVNVASYWAGDLDLDDLEFKRRSYDNNRAYRQSKQASRMLTVALAERLNPGDVSSKLSNNLGFGGSQSPDEGARTPVWLATDPVGQQETGQYFERMQPVTCRFGADRQAVEQLYQLCLAYYSFSEKDFEFVVTTSVVPTPKRLKSSLRAKNII